MIGGLHARRARESKHTEVPTCHGLEVPLTFAGGVYPRLRVAPVTEDVGTRMGAQPPQDGMAEESALCAVMWRLWRGAGGGWCEVRDRRRGGRGTGLELSLSCTLDFADARCRLVF